MDIKSVCSPLLRIFIILALAAAGCAGLRAPMKMTAAVGKKTVTMTAGDFKFEPSAIQALTGDLLVFEISNTFSTTHNFTIKDPEGQILESVDLPGNKTVSLEIPLRDNGTYEFYCNKTSHANTGMKGYVEALPSR